ncbi:HD-GYP domain-containing protein [Rhizobium sp. 007]|uniref:HD-GYP domain-containing protein n=1 Tax=Rhizobium sp. 007 TaxID=2785056 RepID=UPI0018907551|nr:HD-GYP domain-containing protein [Rhizobium sp. 007]QPB19566.1 HD-GYP domain-containing protein [Rhizobium sp. 007]
MVLRIRKSLLRKGMYIEAVECADLEFSGRRFLLETDSALHSILASSAEYVLINRAKSNVDCGLPVCRQPDEHVQPTSLRESDQRTRIQHAVSQVTATLRDGFDEIKSGKFDIDRFAPAAMNITASLIASPHVLVEVTRLKTKDEGTYIHSLAVSGLMTGLGHLSDLGEETTRELTIAGLLHDLGKLLIPNAILNKSGQLTDAERHVMRTHPERGYLRLKQHPEVSDLILEICRFHHEALDGSGYPLGLRADRLSLPVRICTVCDVFDALTSVRPYKRAWTSTEALKWMFDRGHLFDRRLVLRLGSLIN